MFRVMVTTDDSCVALDWLRVRQRKGRRVPQEGRRGVGLRGFSAVAKLLLAITAVTLTVELMRVWL